MIRLAAAAMRLAAVGLLSVIAGFYLVGTMLGPRRDVPRAS